MSNAFTASELAAMAQCKALRLPMAIGDTRPTQWDWRPDHAAMVSLSELIRHWHVDHDGKPWRAAAASKPRRARNKRQERTELALAS
jgi:hypothetical protein